MFSLGEKFRVLNTNADVAFYDASNAAVTTGATVVSAPATYFKIKGFGKFPIASITDFRGSRAKAAAVEVATHLVVAPTGVAVGNVIEAKITLATERYEGELANNYITGSRPIVIQTAPLTGITITNIGDAIAAAWLAYIALFNKATFALSTLTDAAGTLTSTIATGYEGVSVAKIEISIAAQGSGSYPKTTLVKTVTTAGSQGRGLGKFLEESIHTSTAANTRAYGMDTADTQVDLRGSYTQFNWRMTANYDEVLGNSSSDNKPTAEHDFTLFLNESTCLGVDLAIGLMASGVILKGAPAVAAVAAPLTTAQFSVAALINKTDAAVATNANFVA